MGASLYYNNSKKKRFRIVKTDYVFVVHSTV